MSLLLKILDFLIFIVILDRNALVLFVVDVSLCFFLFDGDRLLGRPRVCNWAIRIHSYDFILVVILGSNMDLDLFKRILLTVMVRVRSICAFLDIIFTHLFNFCN